MSTDNQANEIHLTEEDGNRITAVTVFTNQAQIKRQFTVNAQTGMNRYTVELTAFSIDQESAQAQVFGKGEILGVQYLQIPVKDIPQQKIRELDDEKRKLTQQKKTLIWKRESLQRQIRFLDSLTEFAEVEIPKEIKTEFPPMDRIEGVVGFLDIQYNRLGEQEQQLTEQIEEYDREITAVDRHLKSLRKSTSSDHKVIEVMFNSSEEQEIAIEVSYIARYAAWQPVYKIDVPAELEKVSLTLFSRIQQKTGEDWHDVKLSLSNALPVTSTELPDLNSWHLRQAYAPVAAMAVGDVMMAGSANLEEATVVFDELSDAGGFEELAAQEPQASYAQAEQKELPVAFEYDVPQNSSIESGDQDSLIPLSSSQLDGEFYHYAAPAVDQQAYLVCQTGGDRSLMSARLNIHFDGRFIGGTQLAEKKPGEDLLLNLGPQRGIKVSREKAVDKIAETFFGIVDRNSVARELQFRISVENLKDKTERIQIIDRVPVSTTDRFQVKGVEMKPEPTEQDWKKREGVMLWELDVEPGKTREITIKFFVKHPKGQSPTGL